MDKIFKTPALFKRLICLDGRAWVELGCTVIVCRLVSCGQTALIVWTAPIRLSSLRESAR